MIKQFRLFTLNFYEVIVDLALASSTITSYKSQAHNLIVKQKAEKLCNIQRYPRQLFQKSHSADLNNLKKHLIIGKMVNSNLKQVTHQWVLQMQLILQRLLLQKQNLAFHDLPESTQII